MLSYMIPVDEKPPPGPGKSALHHHHHHQHHNLQPHLHLNLMQEQQQHQLLQQHHQQQGNNTTMVVTTTTTNGRPPQHHHQQPSLTTVVISNNNTQPAATGGGICFSKDSSVSSFASDLTTATGTSGTTVSSATPTSGASDVRLLVGGGKGGVKLMGVNGGTGKHQSLKRVSFGSSKGSMVETLIYESPLQEEPEPSPIPENANPFPEDQEQTEDDREKVRVSFVQQSKPQEVVLPDEPVILSDTEFMMAATAIAESDHIIRCYTRHESVESGWDNPFRPGGDLSREADEIVELIKGGKPITPTTSGLDSLDHTDNNHGSVATPQHVVNRSTGVASPVNESPQKAAAVTQPLLASSPPKQQQQPTQQQKNGTSAPAANKNGNAAEKVDVQRGTVGPPSDGTQAEHVVLKKKPKCKCCVVQ